ncbi:hypothetical protein AB6A40_001668 [Gnathostoma spinigerum]|uniref:Uncharacterized protein n=1 Tax=Gnathostoma spinigerum TaxID=75299 RepID=A0ABD6EC94_9BILA
MVGKKSSLPKLKEKLRRLCDARYMVSSLNQGKTQRWVLTWTFDPDIKLMSNHHECRPMEVRLPNSMPPRAAFFEWLKLTLANLEITMDPIGDEEYLCKSSKNTWSNQRNKRRAMILQSPSSSLQLPQPKKARYSHVDVSVTANLGVGDGKDSLSDAGNFNSCSDIAVSSQRSDAVIQAYHPVSSESHSLVTFRLCLKYSKSCLHLRWVDGSRHALHQITQYLRNHLSKNLLIA